MIEMELAGVRVEMRTNQPILLLREIEGSHRLVPIFIGGNEATAISLALEGVEPPRPMTHDLFATTIESLGGTLERVVVTELRDKTFFAELEFVANDATVKVSARPSDGIALAVRTGSPIFAAESVVEEAGYVDPESSDDDQVVEEFREFLDHVSPEDFES